MSWGSGLVGFVFGWLVMALALGWWFSALWFAAALVISILALPSPCSRKP